MYLLDTDTLSHYFRGDPRVAKRLQSHPQELLFISIVTVEESLRGRLAVVQQKRNSDACVQAYAYLLKQIEDLRQFQTVPYDQQAHQHFLSFSTALRRAGVQDCRIAASALANDLIVVTANTRHYGAIPGLQVEDWTL